MNTINNDLQLEHLKTIIRTLAYTIQCIPQSLAIYSGTRSNLNIYCADEGWKCWNNSFSKFKDLLHLKIKSVKLRTLPFGYKQSSNWISDRKREHWRMLLELCGLEMQIKCSISKLCFRHTIDSLCIFIKIKWKVHKLCINIFVLHGEAVIEMGNQ